MIKLHNGRREAMQDSPFLNMSGVFLGIFRTGVKNNLRAYLPAARTEKAA